MIAATIFPIRWAMAALGSTIGLHSDKISGDKLFGDDYTYHGTLYSIYSQSDATQRILLSWFALGAIIVVLTFTIGICLKRKDVRTADRANIRTLLDKINEGKPLTTQERDTLWSYLERYGRLEGERTDPAGKASAGE